MPFAPPDRPSRFQLGAVRVGNPVSAYHGARLVNDIAELLAVNVQSHADCTFNYNYGGGAANASVFWSRNPGCAALLVGVELQETDSGRAVVTVTNNGSALTWIQANGLDGSLTLPTPPASTHVVQLHHGIVDATGFLTDGTVYRLDFAIATSTGALLQRVFVREISEAQVAPDNDTTEVSASAAWPFYRPGPGDAVAGLVDGKTTDPFGWIRLVDQLEHGRTLWRDWRQWTFPELDAYAPQRTSTTIGDFTWPNGGAYTPTWFTRARRLYGTSVGTATPETVTAVVRYKCGGTGGTIRIITDGATNNDFTVAAAGSYTTLSLGTLTLKTSNANQRIQLGVQGKVATTGQLTVPTIALYSTET